MADQDNPKSGASSGFKHQKQWTGFHDPEGIPAEGFGNRFKFVPTPLLPISPQQAARDPELKKRGKKMGRPASSERGLVNLQIYASNVQLLHLLAGKDIKEVANQAGISVDTVKRVKNGLRTTKPENRHKVVQAYACFIGCKLAAIDLEKPLLTEAMIEEAKSGGRSSRSATNNPNPAEPG